MSHLGGRNRVIAMGQGLAGGKHIAKFQFGIVERELECHKLVDSTVSSRHTRSSNYLGP